MDKNKISDENSHEEFEDFFSDIDSPNKNTTPENFSESIKKDEKIVTKNEKTNNLNEKSDTPNERSDTPNDYFDIEEEVLPSGNHNKKEPPKNQNINGEENFSTIEEEEIEERNQKLIDEVKYKQSTQIKKKRKKRFIIVWIIAIILLFGGTTAAVLTLVNQVPTEEINNENPISIAIVDDTTNQINKEVNGTIMPGTVANVKLIIKNNSTDDQRVFIRFGASITVNDVASNERYIKITPPNIDGEEPEFYYSEINQKWYYAGRLKAGEELNIVKQIEIQGDNDIANKKVGYTINIDAIEAKIEAVDNSWDDGYNTEWYDIIRRDYATN